jgi:predicted N-acetyltransferase YhbS
MTELHIRDARDDERDTIRELTLSAYQQYAVLMPGLWERYRQGIEEALADRKPADRIVAERDGTLVGSVLLYPIGTVFSSRDGVDMTFEVPEMRLLAVPPEVRGQGVAAALVRECVRRARQSGATALTLHTTDLMTVAMGMYERMGFVRAPELDFHPTPSFTVKGYRLALTEQTGHSR